MRQHAENGVGNQTTTECDGTDNANNINAAVKNILVTGGAGFIGGWFIRHMLKTYGNDYEIICLDSLEYCASFKNFSQVEHLPNFHFIKGDISDQQHVERILKDYHVDAIIHLAAESHVDHSFKDPLAFTAINILGTHCLLETCRKYDSIKRFVYVSTDEVYGPNETELFPFTEEHPLKPTNPYAATKAAAEMIIHSYRKSFQMPTIVTRCNNVFGPYQYPEKLISKFIILQQKGGKIPIQGDGRNIRAFIFAADVAEALDTIFHKGADGETYNISSDTHLQVLQVAEKIFQHIAGQNTSDSLTSWVENIEDRPYNDKPISMKV
ncbi:hypothetical protein N7533_008469 [Penicillium manginii]|uniref:uncharacterized protein n=1 Tax=Penicillium manginii TaxID=203109 RepID=UPI00254852B3|nr:uncharacterized protein N7533_008469 [Penicillium manginii]KAJ5743599.1 hypothetical protein N7533_008469 [Penicillium manginii]